MEKGFCGRGRQRHIHFFQKVGVKNLMQDAVTVAAGAPLSLLGGRQNPQNLEI